MTFSEEVWFIMSIRGTRVILFLSEMSLLSYRQYTHRVLTTNQFQNSEYKELEGRGEVPHNQACNISDTGGIDMFCCSRNRVMASKSWVYGA